MKYLKKINKGLALTIIVLLVLVIYLINVEAKRNSEKTKIELACKEYIELIDNYIVLPEEAKKLYSTYNTSNEEKENINAETNKAIDEQIAKLEKELKEKMIDNELAVKMQRDTIKDLIEGENDVFASVVTNYRKEISKIKKFEFDDDQVTVTFTSNIEKETKYLEENQEEVQELSNKDNFSTNEETITLQNVNGTWKVVYADLQYYNYNSNGGYVTTMMMY